MLKKLFRKRDYNFNFMRIRKIGFTIALAFVIWLNLISWYGQMVD